MPKTKIFFLLTLCSVVSCHPSGNGLGIIPRSGGIDVVMIKQEQNKGKFCFDTIDFSLSISLMQCQDKCEQNTACVGISYSPSHKWCKLCPTLENIKVCTICNPHEKYEWDNYEKLSKLVATDGTVLEKSSTNAECCSTNSILESEDGSTWRSPLVYSHGGTGELLCTGQRKHTFAQWIDMVASFTGNWGIKGICYNGWMYQKST